MENLGEFIKEINDVDLRDEEQYQLSCRVEKLGKFIKEIKDVDLQDDELVISLT